MTLDWTKRNGLYVAQHLTPEASIVYTIYRERQDDDVRWFLYVEYTGSFAEEIGCDGFTSLAKAKAAARRHLTEVPA